MPHQESRHLGSSRSNRPEEVGPVVQCLVVSPFTGDGKWNAQDQDLSEAIDDVKSIAALQKRWITVACAYPYSPGIRNSHRGVERTQWVKISQTDYDTCLDPADYRLKWPASIPPATP